MVLAPGSIRRSWFTVVALLAGLWPGLAGALLLGLAVGALAGRPRGYAVPLGLGAALAGLGGLALTGLVPGVGGVWTESAALMLAAYGAGCGLGSLAHPR